MFGSRFGGLLGVELADGVDCFDFLNRLRIVLMATHLGDTRSLARPPPTPSITKWAPSGASRWASPTA